MRAFDHERREVGTRSAIADVLDLGVGRLRGAVLGMGILSGSSMIVFDGVHSFVSIGLSVPVHPGPAVGGMSANAARRPRSGGEDTCSSSPDSR